MASKELVPGPRTIAVEEQKAEQRRAALERLNAEAETADAYRAKQIMLQGRLVAQAIKEAKEPFEDAWLAGKASVVAARRLGIVLSKLPSSPQWTGGREGSKSSVRHEVANELGLSLATRYQLARLARIPDPDFQRYIQDRSRIPSLTGLLRRHAPTFRGSGRGGSAFTRRRRAGVVSPKNPSLDKAYSLIVLSLGHLGNIHGGRARNQAISLAMRHLYEAEELLKPYRAGYDGTGRKAA